MTKITSAFPARAFGFIAAITFGFFFPLKADVIVLQSGAVITGTILQQDASGVLMQMAYGTYRYPQAWLKDVKKEAAAAPHVSNNGQVIPDWAQIVTALANSGWAPEIKQVPAPVISSGNFKNVPYISFRCAYGGYEINIYGDLNNPAAVQVGAMGYLQNNAAAKTNCINLICSVLANAADRKLVRALSWSQKDAQTNGNVTVETLMPGEMGAYGGWWVSAYDATALANAQASDAELLALAQPRTAVASPAPATTNNAAPAATTQPAATTPPPATSTDSGQITSSGTYTPAYYNGWTAAELADARPAAVAATTYPAVTADKAYATSAGSMVYPRSYTREGGTYGRRR